MDNKTQPENVIELTEESFDRSALPSKIEGVTMAEAKRLERNRKARERNRAKTQAYRDCGLTPGRDSMGRRIWE